MKTILSISKTVLLCILLLAASTSFAQLIPTTFNTTQGQCVDLGVDTFSGITIDTFNILSAPLFGQLLPGSRPNSWIYCPHSSFIGVDSAIVYVCISGPLFPICDTVELFFVVQSGCNVTATITPVNNFICSGESTTLTAIGSNGNPPYSYLWSVGATTASITVSPSSTTTYSVTVTDDNGCTASASRTVNVNLLPTPSISPANVNFCSGASASLTASGGTSYSWNTAATSATITVSPAITTTYSVTVTNANGCTATASRIITVHPIPTATISQSIDSINCPGGTLLTVSPTGGTPPYNYVWSNAASSQSICVSLPATYCLTVTDDNGCTSSACSNVGGGCNLSIAIQNGPCAGPLPSLIAVANGGTPPYQYLWSNGVSSDVVCNLTSGTYCVTVIDFNNCSITSCQNVTGGCQLTAAILEDSVICAGRTGLSIIPALGTGPYTYIWSDFNTTQTICPTIAGTYCATVVDASGCDASACYQFGGGCQFSVSVVLDSITGCLLALSSGGTPPFSYQWSDGSTGPTHCNINPLLAYTVIVTDSSGCVGTATYNSSGCQLFSTITQSGSCFAVTTTGGTPGYSFAWSNGATTSTICPGMPGTYCVTVTDAQACTNTHCGTIGGCQITVTIVLDSSRCMNAVATGGTPPFTYLWNDGSTASINCNLNPGVTYTVTVSDANGCTGTAWYFDPGCQITVAVSYDSLNNCYTVSATGGQSPYIFLWSDNSMGSSVCNVLPGTTYCVTVSDVNGCSGTACNNQTQGCSFTYTQSPFFPSVVVFVASYDSLLNPANVQWELDDGTTGTGFQLTHTYSVCNMTYTVIMTLTDSLGNNLCSYTQTVYVPCSQNFCQASFSFFQDSVNNRTFHFKDRSVYNPVSFVWDFGDGTSDTSRNPTHTYTTAGIYNVCVVVTDANGCSSTYCQQVNAGNVQIQDLTAYLHHYTTVTPGFPLWASLSYCNYGNILMNGTVEYHYPAGATFVSATPPPTSHNAVQRLLTFSFTNLLPGTCGSIAVDLTVDPLLPLGTVANDTMWVKPITGDINPANNVSTISVVVIGSWDPNDKAVSPKGLGDDGEIPLNMQTLSYKVRFQNTGTATAQNVVIRDAIDNGIDLSSVKVTDASHEHMTEIIGNELVVTFNNIMLLDSNANELASHGYIQIVADLKPGLTNGTQIFNTAEIYFDFNPAVITNTVMNTLKDEGTGIKQSMGLDFNIMPNPAQDEIVISGKFSRNSTYEIVNGLGQIAMNGDVLSDRTKVFIGKLNAGVYFLRIKSKDKTGVQRLVVSE